MNRSSQADVRSRLYLFKVPVKEMSDLQDGKYSHALAVAKVAKIFSKGHTEETETPYKKLVPKAIVEVARGVRPYYFAYNKVQVNMPEDRLYWRVEIIYDEKENRSIPVFKPISKEEYERIKEKSRASVLVKPRRR